MEKCLIVAVAKNLAIGRDGDMPWHLPGDLKYFKKTTMSCPVIMGRRTWESIGRPLPGRQNIVISSHPESVGEGAVIAGSLEEAFVRAGDAPRVFVIGGAKVYAAAMGIVDRMYITRIDACVEDADAFFPEFDPQEWELESRSSDCTDENSGVVSRFEVYNHRRKTIDGEEKRRIREPDGGHPRDGGLCNRLG